MHNREKAVAAAAASSTPQQNLRKRAIKVPPFLKVLEFIVVGETRVPAV